MRNGGWILGDYLQPRNNIITTETPSGRTKIGELCIPLGTLT